MTNSFTVSRKKEKKWLVPTPTKVVKKPQKHFKFLETKWWEIALYVDILESLQLGHLTCIMHLENANFN